MLCRYERKVLAFVALCLILLACCFGCNSSLPPKTQENLYPSTMEGGGVGFLGLSVHYLDVGQGDCILICFPDGKSMMIDCGNGSASAVNVIKNALQAKGITALDYLILTHPANDHTGGVSKALEDINVKSVYHPDIPSDLVGFEKYYSAIRFLSDKGAEMKISLQGECFGGDYKVAILEPTAKSMQDSSYRDFLWTLEPTETQINDLSPYVYLEYQGFRFLFTGDCSSRQEEKLITDYASTKFDKTFSVYNLKIKLENIDFLKIAHHGSSDSSSMDFLSLLKPKYSIISVAGDNPYGQPSSTVQTRILNSSEQAQILRTDIKGTISIFITETGVMTVS